MSVVRKLLCCDWLKKGTNIPHKIICLHSRPLSFFTKEYGTRKGLLFRSDSPIILSGSSITLKPLSISNTTILSRYASEQSQNKSDEKQQGIDNASQKKTLTTSERMKIITTQYGAFGMAFHITISLASLGLFYFLVYSGMDFKILFTWLGMESSSLATGASTFVVAYAVHKVFAPVRIAITFVSVPVLVRHFRKIGFFKKK